MLIYEVNLSVSGEIAADYAEFLRHHMDDVVRAGGFSCAQWWQRQAADENMENPDGRMLWTIHYHVATREILELYLRDHAPRMRAEAMDKFGDRFQASRRVLTLRKPN